MEFLMCKLSHCRSPIGGLPKVLSPKLMYGCTPLDLPIQVEFSIPWSHIFQDITQFGMCILSFLYCPNEEGCPLPSTNLTDKPGYTWVCPTLSLFQEALILDQPLHPTISWNIMGWPIHQSRCLPSQGKLRSKYYIIHYICNCYLECIMCASMASLLR